MDLVTGIIVVIAGIGVIIAGLIGLVAVFAGWWFLIPIVGAFIGGWLGFFFGLGLVAVIGCVVMAVKK